MFGFVEKESQEFKKMLDVIEDREYLWTDYGIRSLSKQSHKYH